MQKFGRGVPLLLAWLVFFGISGKARAEDNLSKQADDIGKSVGKAVHRTGEYLKSDSFRQDVGRVARGASKALQNGEKWVGAKLKERHGPDSKRP